MGDSLEGDISCGLGSDYIGGIIDFFVKQLNNSSSPEKTRQSVIGKFDTPMPEKLLGTWISTYGEINSITNTTYSTDTGYGGYAGTIVNHRDDGLGAGYITIQFTQNDSDPGAIGKYYVLRYYESLVSSTVSIMGAYSGDDPDFNYPKGGGNRHGKKRRKHIRYETDTLAVIRFPIIWKVNGFMVRFLRVAPLPSRTGSFNIHIMEPLFI